MNMSYNPGLYLHIPFCQSKCGYCDFYSVEGTGLIKPFVRALISEIKNSDHHIQTDAIFDTIYLGGGTPSLLSIEDLELILNTLADQFHIDPTCEITIEINPGTVNLAQLKDLIALGINRISVGVQSFLDHELATADRIHSAEEAVHTIYSCREAGFRNINIDLIFALPGQTIRDWNYSLEKVVSFTPEHLSVYNLSYEEGTPFYNKKMRGEYCEHGETKETGFFNSGHQFLIDKGYIHYEVSNYSKSQSLISRHNYKYWNHTPYLGFGPSAHSFWNKTRWANVRSVTEYIATIDMNKRPLEFSENLTTDDLRFEHIFLALRTYRGISLEDFKNRFGILFEETYKSETQILKQQKLAKTEDGYFKLTEKGMLICDDILPQFSTI